MSHLLLASDLPPSLNEFRKYRVMYGRVQTYKTDVAKHWESSFIAYVKKEIKRQKWKTPDKGKYLVLEVTFYFSRINQDADNYYKLMNDCLQKAKVIENDCKFIPRTKRVYIESKNPRMEIDIYEASYVGVFNDETKLEDFKAFNCSVCKKNTNTCTVLSKALENRITGDISIETNQCFKLTPKE
jgi:Holliday junction resolvase RusA-like endonuclease